MDLGALTIKTLETSRVLAPRESFDRLPRLDQVGVQIQHAAVAPGVSGNDRALEQRDMFVKAGAGIDEQLFKNRAHGKYSGSAIYQPVINLPHVHFAAGG